MQSPRWRVLVLVLLLAGCRLDVATSIVVDDEGAGSIELLLTVDDELRDELASAGAAVDELVPTVEPGGRWRVEPVAGPDATGARVRAGFAGPADLGAAVDGLLAGLDPDDGTVLRDVALVRDTEDGGLELSLTGGLLPPEVLGTAPQGAPGGGTALARTLRQRGDDLATARLEVTFATVPVIVEGDGEVSGTTATLTLPVGALATVVVAAPPDRLTANDALVAGGVGLGAAVVTVVLVARRRRLA